MVNDMFKTGRNTIAVESVIQTINLALNLGLLNRARRLIFVLQLIVENDKTPEFGIALRLVLQSSIIFID